MKSHTFKQTDVQYLSNALRFLSTGSSHERSERCGGFEKPSTVRLRHTVLNALNGHMLRHYWLHSGERERDTYFEDTIGRVLKRAHSSNKHIVRAIGGWWWHQNRSPSTVIAARLLQCFLFKNVIQRNAIFLSEDSVLRESAKEGEMRRREMKGRGAL